MVETLAGEFNVVSTSKIIFGPGTALAKVCSEVESLGKKRALIVTTNSLVTKTNLVQKLKEALSDKCAGIFSGTKQHVPRSCVYEGARVAREVDADILVSIGGGSTIDATKGIAIVVAEGDRLDDYMIKVESPNKMKVPQITRPKMSHIAISTTLSGAEFTCTAGIRDEIRKRKDGYMDPQLVPKVIILDPEVTLATNRMLWASTGVKVLSDCVEMVCSLKNQPLTDGLCLHAVRLIFENLLLSLEEPINLNARGLLQHATWMTVFSFPNVSTGTAASLRHQIGGMYNIPHGIAGTILLPHVMRFSRSITANRQAMIAQAIGINTQGMTTEEAAAAATDAVLGLIKRLELPQRLREVGVPESDLENIAASAFEDVSTPTNPIGEVLEILRNAW
jgi:alcohol dehydrogenase class IV